MSKDERQFDTLPPEIVGALRQIDGPSILPDAGRDADVLSGARRHLVMVGPSRKRRRMRLFVGGAAGGALAAAAMVGIVVMLGEPTGKSDPAEYATATQPQTTVDIEPGDYNANGTLDILDAYLLAKTVSKSSDLHPGNDLNGDGLIDQRDIDWIANQAVALNLGEQG